MYTLGRRRRKSVRCSPIVACCDLCFTALLLRRRRTHTHTRAHYHPNVRLHGLCFAVAAASRGPRMKKPLVYLGPLLRYSYDTLYLYTCTKLNVEHSTTAHCTLYITDSELRYQQLFFFPFCCPLVVPSPTTDPHCTTPYSTSSLSSSSSFCALLLLFFFMCFRMYTV